MGIVDWFDEVIIDEDMPRAGDEETERRRPRTIATKAATIWPSSFQQLQGARIIVGVKSSLEAAAHSSRMFFDEFAAERG